MSDENLAELRRLYAKLGDGDGTPSDEELAALVVGELKGRERQRVVDQLIESPEAAARYRLLKQLHKEAKLRRRHRPWHRPWRWPAAVAATAIIVVMAAVLLVPAPVEDLQLRGGSGGAFPTDMQTLTEAPGAMRWPASVGAVSVRVSLYDESATLVWETEAPNGNELTLDPAQREAMSGGGVFYWIATTRDDRELGPYWFRIDPE